MKPDILSHLHCYEELRYSRFEEDDTGLRSRIEDGRLRRRREWEMEQEHKRLKKKNTSEYEMQRVREKELPLPKIKDTHYSRSKSRSRSPKDQHRRTETTSMTTSILLNKLESSSGTTTLFRELESIETGAAKLRRIILIDNHEDISGKTTTRELQQAIVALESVMLKRREGKM